MKLINFYESTSMNSLLKDMGAELKRMTVINHWERIDDDKLAELLKTGEVEIDLEEIDIKDGIFDYKGRKVIVYIRDQYSKYHSKGYKYHLTNCNTISKAFKNKRNSRYVISLRTDGKFKINLFDNNAIVKEGLIESLNVCKNCLDQVNYKRYKTSIYDKRKNIYDNFSLIEYFDQFKVSDLSENLFKTSNNAPLNTYSKNFSKISKQIRENRGYMCENCYINLYKIENRKFAHVHHIDGDKSNNNPANLQVLCIECHAELPGHNWLRNNPDYINFMRIKNDLN